MKDFCWNCWGILSAVFVFFNILAIFLGTVTTVLEEKNVMCAPREMRRIEYVIPGLKLGCWLGGK